MKSISIRGQLLSRTIQAAMFAAITISLTAAAKDSDMEKLVEHGYATNNGVKIHYVAMGKGPAAYLYYKDVNRDPLGAESC